MNDDPAAMTMHELIEKYEQEMYATEPDDTNGWLLYRFHLYMCYKNDPHICLEMLRSNLSHEEFGDVNTAFLQVFEILEQGSVQQRLRCIRTHLSFYDEVSFGAISDAFPCASEAIVCPYLAWYMHVFALEQKVLPYLTENMFLQKRLKLLDFLIKELRMFAKHDIEPCISCFVVPVLVPVLASLPEEQRTKAVEFVYALSLCPESREHLAEPRLFEALAAWLDSPIACQIVDDVFRLSQYFVDHERHDVLLRPIVERCFQILRVSFLRTSSFPFTYSGEVAAHALAFLERCTSTERKTFVRRAWHSWLCRSVTKLLRGKTHLPFDLATFVCHLLEDTTSVELVVRMERTGVLPHMLEACEQYRQLVDDYEAHAVAWGKVQTLLHVHWPAKVAQSLGETNHGPREGTVQLECPLTLARCVHPVVASDGHVYERDAILRHMASVPDDTEALSPLTRQPLEYHLYPLRGV